MRGSGTGVIVRPSIIRAHARAKAAGLARERLVIEADWRRAQDRVLDLLHGEPEIEERFLHLPGEVGAEWRER